MFVISPSCRLVARPVSHHLLRAARKTTDEISCGRGKLDTARQNTRNSLWLVVTAARIATICSDMTVLIVTWSKTYQVHRDAAIVNLRMPVTNLLIRDGTCLDILHLKNVC